MPKPKRGSVLVVVSDLHCGSTLGLCTPEGVELPEGGVYRPSRGQRWLWANWLDFIGQAQQAARGRACYVVLNGDLVDGPDHHDTTQTISRARVVQSRIAAECIEPLARLADRLIVVRGTPVHTGSDEDALGKDFGAERSPEGGWSWWQWVGEIGGVLFDVAHHPSGGGGRPWTAGGPAVRLAAEMLMYYAGRRERVPDIAIRSHVHLHHDSYQNVPGCRGIITPAWQLRTEYAHRIAARPAHVGGLIITIENGAPEVRVALYAPERTAVWRPK